MQFVASSRQGTMIPSVLRTNHTTRPRSVCNRTPVGAAVRTSSDTVVVEIAFDTLQGGSPHLQWGVFRSSIAKWHQPQEMQPEGSVLHQATGTMRTPMLWDEQTDRWLLSFKVSRKLMPLHLGMVIYWPEYDQYETPQRGSHFAVPLGMRRGEPAPFGAVVVAHEQASTGATFSINFSLPEQVNEPAAITGAFLEVALDPCINRSGNAWHIQLEGLRDLETLCYAWRAEGPPEDRKEFKYFHPGFLLLDPHAPLALPVRLPEAVLRSAPRLAPNLQQAGLAYMGCLAGMHDGFLWDDEERPRVAAEDLVLYELDVASFSAEGTFLGVIVHIEDIVATGATAVLINRLALTGSGQHTKGARPLSLFAPEPSFASGSPLLLTRQLKAMVQALHHAGLEVLLEVEFSLMGEGTTDDPRMVSLRGLDALTYFRQTTDQSVLNTGHPVAGRLMLEALRHWAMEFHMDGFVFATAENMVQDRDGLVLDAPAIVEEIAQDSLLRGLKLIASCSSSGLLPRTGVRGFPHWGAWMELNSRFQSDAWAYVHEARHGMLSVIATRIAGSPDLFAASWGDGLPGNLACERRASFGINSVVSLGNHSLLAAVDAAGGGQMTGTVARSIMTLQFMSAGVPMLSHATTSSSPELASFVAALVAVRQEYIVLLCPPLWAPPRNLLWHGMAAGSTPDWAASHPAGTSDATFVAFSLTDSNNRALYVALNPANVTVSAALPPAPAGSVWRLLVDASAFPPNDANAAGLRQLAPGEASINVGARGAVVLDVVVSTRAAAATSW